MWELKILPHSSKILYMIFWWTLAHFLHCRKVEIKNREKTRHPNVCHILTEPRSWGTYEKITNLLHRYQSQTTEIHTHTYLPLDYLVTYTYLFIHALTHWYFYTHPNIYALLIIWLVSVKYIWLFCRLPCETIRCRALIV